MTETGRIECSYPFYKLLFFESFELLLFVHENYECLKYICSYPGEGVHSADRIKDPVLDSWVQGLSPKTGNEKRYLAPNRNFNPGLMNLVIKINQTDLYHTLQINCPYTFFFSFQIHASWHLLLRHP